MSRRFITLLLLALSFHVNNWRLVNEYITRLVLDANSQDLGQVIYRDYEHEAPAGTLQVIITQGVGTGALYVPEKVNASKGLMPSDSGYEVLKVSGRKAIIESQSFMPLVLAINVDDNTILTIESASLSHDEIINFAEEILSQQWNITKSD